jgi:hypothetical protein
VFSKAKLVITILALTAAGCAGDSIGAASAGGTLAVDAGPVQTLSGASVSSGPERAPITGRDWNCPRCYK